MKHEITNGNVIKSLRLWLVVALSIVGESKVDGFDWVCFFFGCPSPSPPSSTPGTPAPIPPSPSAGTRVLAVGFYKGLCPNNVDIEATVRTKVEEEFRSDPTLLPALLRMQFHDCFADNGCDASILIDGATSEKTAGANTGVRGFVLIDTLKHLAESSCPGKVSCADLIAIATAELLKQGGGPLIPVKTGRNDGLESSASNVNLPGPTISVDQSIQTFATKKFTKDEMVALLGCHTVGVSECQFFEDRIYSGNSQFDPNMDPELRSRLVQTCPKGMSSRKTTSLDQNPQSSNIVDVSYYNQILKSRGILQIDQALARDKSTNGSVLKFAQNPALFNSQLATAMIKLQDLLNVRTGNQGEVRNSCRSFN